MHNDSSSDEEDDRRNLVDQNHRKPPSPSPAAVFHVEDRSPRFFRRNFIYQKKYIVTILAFLLVILFFSVANFHSVFSSSSFQFDSVTDRMKESELRAINLLRRQQLGLLIAWNTTRRSNASDPNQLEDLKSALFKQISLNQEIQQVLLNPHSMGNIVEPEFDLNATLNGVVYDRCRTVDQNLSQRRTIQWNPRDGKFLLAICVSGQMSNHLICLEKHIFFAALLNRALVIPSSKVDYRYDRVVDIDRINKCLGKKVVFSFEEFSNIKKGHMHIDKFLCYFSKPTPCYLDDEWLKKLGGLGVTMNKQEAVWDEDTRNPKNKTAQDVLGKFNYDDDVMAIGDVFYAEVEPEWVMQPGGPIAHQCKTLIEPNHLISLTAQRFIQTFLGRNFIALHFRRHGFLKFCNAKKPSCFYPIPQAADCIMRVVERADAPIVYLSTDAAESETGLLQSLVVLNGRPVPLVMRPARNSAEKWDALLYRHGLEGDTQVEAMLDKTICAMSSVFIGAPGSTFTEDILRLRRGWGSASICDEYLCHGEEPDIVAENE
ncbi:O-fucosyltransferase 36 [Vigna angularis]|uniref:O-fucosyltransferase family protein n=3 Tax=Phaseolus angularis TaxID=3914 RepID=A0A8T0JPU4_PHAAN|nr:O-fucosyltransferase 36 [Vigna angularis]KAG2380104.1 O-fucosyltransferase 36 [Vigna angularis]BAT98220.1 hypothetical protein VIGAN_09186000 [Vigna angularis var. angularis]